MDSENTSQVPDASSPVTESSQQHHHHHHHQRQPKEDETVISRQQSIYTLTLDEFQNTINESGKNFGSMNMDEFLNSIWTAEENQAQAQAQAQCSSHTHPTGSNINQYSAQFPGRAPNPGPGLPRQGSFAIPEPLYGKTVDEVWSRIHRANGAAAGENPAANNRQLTFGEMTLEDFLVRAGIVRAQAQHAYDGVATAAVAVGPTNYAVRGPMAAACSYGPVGVGSPASPVATGGPCGVEGRRRAGDRPVEKVLERRQRRMIKNRESAARSRARKQAYTVELEAELNQLREENASLRRALVNMEIYFDMSINDESERKHKRKSEEASEEKERQVKTKARKVDEKLRDLQRSSSF
ncbi:basic-leucine zipper transcription factor family protein [Striga asiatica]|uniref:Basic-leucine zipper transcription factor family protein n=1 Tax=Striga asiatica TaxID=4170 RepID=A0A5A7R9V5_STRAF|nr:basic-leucine zipper transcription factor family protein [Striga asiatica]